MVGFGGAAPRIEELDIEDIKAGLAEGSILLVDVREAYEWRRAIFQGPCWCHFRRSIPPRFPRPAGDASSCPAGRAGVRSTPPRWHAGGVKVDAHYAGRFP